MAKFIRITASKDSLAQKNRIIPLDAQRILQYTRASDTSVDKDIKFGDIGNAFADRKFKDESTMLEEFVIGDIKNLSKAIVVIEIYSDASFPKTNIDKAIEITKKYAEKYSIPLKVY